MEGDSPSKAVKKILFLEDEDILGRLYCNKLEEAGYTVKLCRNAEELIDSHKSFEPDLAFLDHGLQSQAVSGMDMIPVLKKSNPNIKIAMLSNYSEFQMKEEAKKAGANDYLLKINMSPLKLVSYVKKMAF